jgi:hypothetical protein
MRLCARSNLSNSFEEILEGYPSLDKAAREELIDRRLVRPRRLRTGRTVERWCEKSDGATNCKILYPNKLPTVLKPSRTSRTACSAVAEQTLPLACKAGTLSRPKEFRCHGSVIQQVMNRDKS